MSHLKTKKRHGGFASGENRHARSRGLDSQCCPASVWGRGCGAGVEAGSGNSLKLLVLHTFSVTHFDEI